jgi:hypothetical protein
MNTPAKLIIGAFATGCIAVGVAAQIGTLQLPAAGSSAPAGAVEPQNVVSAPTAAQAPSPSPSPQPAPAAATSSSGDHEDGDGGDSGD